MTDHKEMQYRWSVVQWTLIAFFSLIMCIIVISVLSAGYDSLSAALVAVGAPFAILYAIVQVANTNVLLTRSKK